MRRALPTLLVTLFIVWQSGCLFGGKSSYHGVKSYREGRVFLPEHRSYNVGELPRGWYEIETDARAIAFYHDAYRSTMFTDAFCKDAFDDVSHEKLIAKMVGGLQGLQTISSKTFQLDERRALQKHFRGSLDGIEVGVVAVVVKKDQCLFDFVLVTPPQPEKQVTEDFEHFYQAFHFTR